MSLSNLFSSMPDDVVILIMSFMEYCITPKKHYLRGTITFVVNDIFSLAQTSKYFRSIVKNSYNFECIYFLPSPCPILFNFFEFIGNLYLGWIPEKSDDLISLLKKVNWTFHNELFKDSAIIQNKILRKKMIKFYHLICNYEDNVEHYYNITSKWYKDNLGCDMSGYFYNSLRNSKNIRKNYESFFKLKIEKYTP